MFQASEDWRVVFDFSESLESKRVWNITSSVATTMVVFTELAVLVDYQSCISFELELLLAVDCLTDAAQMVCSQMR